MSEFIVDYRALGLHPDWENILLEIIDLELGNILTPRRRFILGYILQGYSQRETAELLGLHKRQVQREIYHIRHKKATR
jgi:DNA-directed RNA polymerase specialized sigma24 family protein